MLKRIILIGLALGFILLLVFGNKILLFFDGQKKTLNDREQVFYVERNYSLSGLAAKLYAEGVIDDTSAFLKVGDYKQLDSSKLATGKYRISAHTRYKTLLNGFTKNALGNGNAEIEVQVRIGPCRDLNVLAGVIGKALMTDSSEAIAYLQDPATLRKYGFSSEQFPAMFFADTYTMYWDTDIKQFTERMAADFRAFWTPARKSAIRSTGLESPSQVTTLASIVYGEQSVHPDEWPIIARLYLNRLEKGILLQSDPTFKFCWGDELDGVQRLTSEHRDRDCPYNTYRIKGLPPGPISLVPRAVIDAVLHPQQNSYIYMCAKPDNSLRHNFTDNYTVHMKNAAAYHKFLSARNR